MNGARFVHDELVRYGWGVLVADAQRVKGLAALACKTDKVDARVLAELSFRDLVPAIWLPTPELRAERERSRWRLHLVKHRSIAEEPDSFVVDPCSVIRSRWLTCSASPAARRAGFPRAVARSRPGEP
jgi:hypothetical protein